MYTKEIKQLTAEFCEQEKYRLPNFIPVGMGLGVCFYFLLDYEPNFYLNVIALSLLTLATFFSKSFKWLLCVLLTVSVGFFVAQLRTKTVDTFMLSEKIEKPIAFSAVVETCEKTEKGLMFIVSKTKSFSKRFPKGIEKLHLTWRGKKAIASEQDYVPNTRVLFRAILSPIAPQAFPNAYDFRKQQYFKKISARGFVIKQPKILGVENSSVKELFVEQLRHRINKKIESILPRDTAAVTEALTTGNKSGISKETRNNFVRSGTAHILAISGLHIGIIGFFVFWLFRILLCCFSTRFYDVKKIAAVISWVVVLFYLYISGCSVPSVRAFIMHTLIITAILLNRTAITMRSVAIAATVIMVFTPEVILFPSFQMSFGAVIAIVAFYERAWNFSPLFKMLVNIVATTVIASIPTSMLSIYFFNQLTLNSILANVVSIPLMSFYIMPLAATSLFFMAFNLSYPFVMLTGYGVDFLMKISAYTAQLPGSFFVMPTPTTSVMAILIFSGLLITLIHHKVRLLGFVGVAIGGICYFFQSTPDIFVSQNTKTIGIKTEEGACFNHLGYFRSVTSAWAKSVGIENRERFNSKACRKYITQTAENTFIANIKDKNIIITDDTSFKDDESLVLYLNEPKEFAELIYLPSQKVISNSHVKRPWS